MKKPMFVAAFLLLFANTNVFAKTQGNYIAINSIKAQSDAFEGKTIDYKVDSGSSNGIGFSFMSALNFDNFILAPELFYDQLNINVKDSANDDWNINQRVGIKINIGYDFNDHFAILLNGGLARTSYDVKWTSDTGYSYRENYSDGLIYGVAIKASPFDNFSIILSHDIANIELQEPQYYRGFELHQGDFLKTKIATTKLGLAYRF